MRPALLPAAGQGGRGGGLHVVHRPRQHLLPARCSDTTYPYTPDGNREFLEDKPFIEPFALIAGARRGDRDAALHDLRREAADPPSGARGQAGRVGGGADEQPLRASASAPARGPRTTTSAASPWEGRGKRMDEMIEIMRGLTTGEFFEYHGEHLRHPAHQDAARRPTQPMPILIGGHADAALQRAARLRRRLDARRRRRRRARALHRRGSHELRARGRHRRPAVRDPRHLVRRLHRRRRPAASRTSGVTDVDRRLPQRLRDRPGHPAAAAEVDAIHQFAEDVIAKA